MKELKLRLTDEQFNEVELWAMEVRATPKQVGLVFLMQSVARLIGPDMSYEEEVAETIKDLRKYVDRGECPKPREPVSS